MPTLEHNGLVDMFRGNPSLAPHLLALLFHVDLPRYATVAVVESSVDQLVPVEFRADLVLDLRDEKGAPLLSIVLEIQRGKDRRKKYTWPVYVAVVRASKECDTVLVVVATDADVAGWAAESIDLGLGRGNLKPLVLGPASVPEVTDDAQAEQEAELAVLSAVVHGNGPNGRAVLRAAMRALDGFDQEHTGVYLHIISTALRGRGLRELEKLIMEQQAEGKLTFPPFIQKLIDRGELEGSRKALLRLLARAGIALTEDERARIQACTDAAMLDRWIDNAVGAKTAAEVLG